MMSDVLSRWEAEAKKALQIAQECRETLLKTANIKTGTELCAIQSESAGERFANKFLALIDLIRKKDGALKTISDFTADYSNLPTTEAKLAKEALSLSDRLGSETIDAY